MKRKDKYTVDQVIDMLKLGMTTGLECDKCPCRKYCDYMYAEPEMETDGSHCLDIYKCWLNEEVTMKPRYMTFNDEHDLESELRSFDHEKRGIYSTSALIEWLCEKIEVEE